MHPFLQINAVDREEIHFDLPPPSTVILGASFQDRGMQWVSSALAIVSKEAL